MCCLTWPRGCQSYVAPWKFSTNPSFAATIHAASSLSSETHRTCLPLFLWLWKAEPQIYNSGKCWFKLLTLQVGGFPTASAWITAVEWVPEPLGESFAICAACSNGTVWLFILENKFLHGTPTSDRLQVRSVEILPFDNQGVTVLEPACIGMACFAVLLPCGFETWKDAWLVRAKLLHLSTSSGASIHLSIRRSTAAAIKEGNNDFLLS